MRVSEKSVMPTRPLSWPRLLSTEKESAKRRLNGIIVNQSTIGTHTKTMMSTSPTLFLMLRGFMAVVFFINKSLTIKSRPKAVDLIFDYTLFINL
jgi:hypothetical protein